jgi:hypothetical protein
VAGLPGAEVPAPVGRPRVGVSEVDRKIPFRLKVARPVRKLRARATRRAA